MVKRLRIWKTVTGSVAMVVLLLCVPAVRGQDARPPELDMQYQRAETAFRSGASFLEAKARVDRVIRALPEDAAARKLRARVLLAMDRPEEALRDAQRAAALRPGDGEAHLLVCEAARLTGDAALAAAALEAAADRVFDDPAFHMRLSWNAARLGLLDRAEAYARIALALDATLAPAYYQLARVFVEQGRADDAAAVLARGLRATLLDPEAIRADTTLARVAVHPTLEPLLR